MNPEVVELQPRLAYPAVDHQTTAGLRPAPHLVLAMIASASALTAVASVQAAVALWAVASALVIARSVNAPVRVVLPMTVFAIGPALPGAARLLIEGAAVVASLAMTLASMARRDTPVLPSVLVIAISICWLLLTSHPNVSSLSVGLLGFRKSVMFLLMVAVGLSLRRRYADCAARAVVLVLLALSELTLLVHLLAPDVEQAVTRAAERYTSLFAGEQRLQGLLPGPFHVALMGAVVAIYGLLNALNSRTCGHLVTGLIGLLVVQQTQVRSAFVAVAVGLVLLPALMRPVGESPVLSRSSRRIRAAAPIIVVAAGIALFIAGDPAATSIGTATDDSRLAGRWATWGRAVDLFERSPLIGWGTGSSGDTMGRYFIDGNHVTSHNALLKYLVEGGAVGLTLVSAYLFLVVRGIWRSGAIRTPINPVGAALIGLMVMGLTGAIFEANPVAGLLGVAIGAESGKRSYSA